MGDTNMVDVWNKLNHLLSQDPLIIASFGINFFNGIRGRQNIPGNDQYPYITIEDGGENWDDQRGDLNVHYMRFDILFEQKIMGDIDDSILGNGTDKGILDLTRYIKDVIAANFKMGGLTDAVKFLSAEPRERVQGNGAFVRGREIRIEYNVEEYRFASSQIGMSAILEGEANPNAS